ncbi:hypothetical protein H3146_21365 [Streptomyces sp. OF3]|uniref:Uncharacterized protein n=1 Tax=Streptomyces alkaliterrae TaxID=2213162 RepID=A0A7W3WP33_9ACTN|nr:hypothetical protein [Streptomyces alkaliterrae]MBB1255888.1 hypothetical protein [Streptomyces alkaliterrae]
MPEKSDTPAPSAGRTPDEKMPTSLAALVPGGGSTPGSGGQNLLVPTAALRKTTEMFQRDIEPNAQKAAESATPGTQAACREFSSWSFGKSLKDVQDRWQQKNRKLRRGIADERMLLQRTVGLFSENEKATTQDFSRSTEGGNGPYPRSPIGGL